MINKLTKIILLATIAPFLTLSTTVMADERDGLQEDGMQGSGDLRNNEPRVGEYPIEEDRAGMIGRPAGAFYVDEVVGRSVKHRGSDEEIGEIEEIIIGDDGRIIGVVVTTGGFLGLGGQDVGLAWDHIEHTMEDDESVFYTDIDEETLRNSPRYEWD